MVNKQPDLCQIILAQKSKRYEFVLEKAVQSCTNGEIRQVGADKNNTGRVRESGEQFAMICGMKKTLE